MDEWKDGRHEWGRRETRAVESETREQSPQTNEQPGTVGVYGRETNNDGLMMKIHRSFLAAIRLH